MNYNDGNWHGWYGGNTKPASVHKDSIIDYVWFDEYDEEELCGTIKDMGASDAVAWSQVVKFRVTKVHKEPREFNLYVRDGKGITWPPNESDYEVIKVREVLDDDN